jgi:rhamnosyltransferase
MKPSLSIATVTVTYNPAKILSQQINALKAQTYPIAEFIVVDNASSDGTCEMLASRYPDVTLLPLSENVGVGGGYSAGLEYAALQRKYDWVWILDQDSVPHPNALAALLDPLASINEDTAKIGMLASSMAHSTTQLSYPGLVWNSGWKAPRREESTKPVWFADAVISSGSLVSRETVQTIGLPRADFFMDFVDFEYCLRLRRKGYLIAVVRDSLLEHSIGEPRLVQILGFRRAWADHVPWREYYLSRNYKFTINAYYPGLKSSVYVLGRLLRHALGITLFGARKAECLRMMWMGYQDGRAGRLGIRFTPDEKIQATPFVGHGSTAGA